MNFPFVIPAEPAVHSISEAIGWVSEKRDFLLDATSQQGATLLRGLPLNSGEDFDAIVGAFQLPSFPYEQSLSNAVRINVTDRVFTANEAPPEIEILLHHEMAQTPIYPSKLFFFCENPPDEGGATPLCRSDSLLERLRDDEPQFVADCKNKGIRYRNIIPAEADAQSGQGRSWKSTFRVGSREEAEQRLNELGYTWQWMQDGSLTAITPRLPAIKNVSGRETFFNQLIAATGWNDARNDPREAITFGDGTRLDWNCLSGAVAIAEELTIDLQWQKGDVAVIDNFLVMHGRRPFSGPRRILASMVE